LGKQIALWHFIVAALPKADVLRILLVRRNQIGLASLLDERGKDKLCSHYATDADDVVAKNGIVSPIRAFVNGLMFRVAMFWSSADIMSCPLNSIVA
jgi:hypothetical protein